MEMSDLMAVILNEILYSERRLYIFVTSKPFAR